MQRSNEQEHAAPRPPRSTSSSRPIVPALLSLVAAAATMALAAGCKVNEDKEVAKYREVVDGPTSRPVEFTAGDPLPLETALSLATTNNERIGIGGENYLQALIDKDRAAASFLPTVSLIPSYS